MKINKIKHWILYFGRENPGSLYRLEERRAALWKGIEEVLVDSKLNTAAQRTNITVGCNWSSTISLCCELAQPHLEHCVQFWAPKCENRMLESVRRRGYGDGNRSGGQDMHNGGCIKIQQFGAVQFPWKNLQRWSWCKERKRSLFLLRL